MSEDARHDSDRDYRVWLIDNCLLIPRGKVRPRDAGEGLPYLELDDRGRAEAAQRPRMITWRDFERTY